MKVQPINKTNFGVKVKTVHVLEITTQKIFEPDGFIGITNTMKKIYPLPSQTGMNGYINYAKIISRKIAAKYSQIDDRTKKLEQFIKNKPNASLVDIQIYARSLAAQIGEEIDIVI